MLKENCPSKGLEFFVIFLLDVTLSCFFNFSFILIYSTGIFPCLFMFLLEQC